MSIGALVPPCVHPNSSATHDDLLPQSTEDRATSSMATLRSYCIHSKETSSCFGGPLCSKPLISPCLEPKTRASMTSIIAQA